MSDHIFREALADHLNQQYRGGWKCTDDVVADDINDVDVYWEEGGYTDDDGDPSLRLPSLTVTVILQNGQRRDARPSWIIENLLRATLGLKP